MNTESQDELADNEASCFLDVRNLNAAYGSHQVLESVSLQLNRRQTLVVLGDSGCGKTTLLRAIAGLVPTTTGDITLNQRSIASLSPRERGTVYLDQEPLLFEHLTVFENIAFAMRLTRKPEAAICDAVKRMLTAIDLTEHAHKRDWQLSGGQKQRVAFARAVLARPKLMLLDEPFGSLDARNRTSMQHLFAQLSVEFNLTSIFVTHDVREAFTVGDQFAKLTDGRFHLFKDRAAFIADESTGAQSEISFWRQQHFE